MVSSDGVRQVSLLPGSPRGGGMDQLDQRDHMVRDLERRSPGTMSGAAGVAAGAAGAAAGAAAATAAGAAAAAVPTPAQVAVPDLEGSPAAAAAPQKPHAEERGGADSIMAHHGGEEPSSASAPPGPDIIVSRGFHAGMHAAAQHHATQRIRLQAEAQTQEEAKEDAEARARAQQQQQQEEQQEQEQPGSAGSSAHIGGLSPFVFAAGGGRGAAAAAAAATAAAAGAAAAEAAGAAGAHWDEHEDAKVPSAVAAAGSKLAGLIGKGGGMGPAPGNVAGLLSGGVGTGQPTTAAVGGLITDLSRVQTCISVTVHGEHTHKYTASDLKKLEVGASLYDIERRIQTTTVKEIIRLPAEGIWYLPSDMDDAEASANARLYSGRMSMAGYHVRLLVLFPSQMRPPPWLHAAFVPIDERMRVHCEWGHRSRLEQFILWATDRDDEAEVQTLTVWYSKQVYGQGEEFELFGAGSKGEVTDKPYVPAFMISKDAATLRRLCPESVRELGSDGADTFQDDRMSSRDSLDLGDFLANLATSGKLKVGASGKSGHLGQPDGDASRVEPTPQANIKRIIEMRNDGLIKQLLYAGHFNKTFKDENIQHAIEKLAIERSDASLLMQLIRVTRRELTFSALEFLVHVWSQEEIRQKAAIASEDSAHRRRTNPSESGPEEQ
ncbi:hypothetical protein FOA52_002862, partial [Chlamydomonas sp. UWO 241]